MRRNWRCDGGILPNSLVRMENNRLEAHHTGQRVRGVVFCLVSEEECPVDAQFLRKCVDSIMKLDQKSKSQKSKIAKRRADFNATNN